MFRKSFVFETYKCEWSIVDNESCNRTRLQIYLRNENEIPLFMEFPFSSTTNKPFSQYLSGIALVAPYFGTVNWNLLEISSQFKYSLRRSASSLKTSACLSLDCGNLTLDHQLVWCQVLVFHRFPPTPLCSFFRN